MTQPVERRASDPWRAEMQTKIEKQEQELAEIRKELAENTAIIREMRDIAEMQTKIEKQEQELAEIRKELAENTAIIREMRDILVTAKSGARMFGWLGSAIKWISGVVAAVVALWAAFGHHAPK